MIAPLSNRSYQDEQAEVKGRARMRYVRRERPVTRWLQAATSAQRRGRQQDDSISTRRNANRNFSVA